ncbi:MAG: OB-fold protein [Candidatus Sericytochromatia bacterium]
MGKFFKGCLTLIGGFFVLMVGLAVIASLGNGSDSSRSQAPPETQSAQAPAAQQAPAAAAVVGSVDAATVLKAYENNKLQAEQTYKGKRYRLRGVVDAIGSDILDQPYVSVGTGAQFELVSLQCFFAKGQEGQLAQLNKGQPITLEGTIDDYVMNVIVKDCRL